MSSRNLQRFILALLPVIFLACTKEAPAPTPVPEPVAAPVAVSKPAVVSAPEVKPQVSKAASLAVLAKLKNRADMRPHTESVWQTAAVGTGFLKHDALQTHDSATALVRYGSGSSLDLRENTLVIFDKDPGAQNRFADRVLLKNGGLVGATKKELWVFTNAGLVQIKPVKKNQQAKATLTVDAAKKLNVNVSAGTAEVIVKKNETEFQKFSVAENADYTFKPKNEFTVSADVATAPAVKTPTLAELVIESPADNTVSSSSQVEVRGQLTDMGAKLLINGQIAEISDDLTFKKTIDLTEGTNLVVFQLVRSDASVKFYRKNVRYDKK